MTELPAIPQMESPGQLRQALRGMAIPGSTFGAAPGYLQCNLMILPHGLARDFSTFCAANAQACPLIYQTSPGQWDTPELGDDIDLRTDLGSYRLFRDGQAVADLLDLDGIWQGDFVTFVLGSSFGLESMLAAAGIETPYLARGESPAHYITGIESQASGTFRGPSAVTMRSFKASDADRVGALCEAYAHLHGAPLAIGDAGALDIESLQAPVADIGRPATVQDGEVPIFWASALTAQLALSATRLPFCIANTPGHLLVTDIDIDALRADADEAEGIARPDPAPVATETDIARETVAGSPADERIEGEHGYASAIRPSRPATADTAHEALASDFRISDASAAQADEACLLQIDREEAAAIAADAAEEHSDIDLEAQQGSDDADIPFFTENPPPRGEVRLGQARTDDFPGVEGIGGDDLSATVDSEESLTLDPDEPDLEPASSSSLLLPMEWRQPPLSAGKLIRQRLAAADQLASGRKRESIFW